MRLNGSCRTVVVMAVAVLELMWLVAVARGGPENVTKTHQDVTISSVVLDDRAALNSGKPVPDVEIQINAALADVSDNEKDDYIAIGSGIMVCRARLRKAYVSDVGIVLQNGGGSGNVQFPAAGNVSMNLPKNGDWQEFKITGSDVSAEKDDAMIVAVHGGHRVGWQQLTVLKINIKNPVVEAALTIATPALGPDFMGNEFTFSPATAGVLTMPCRVAIDPDTARVRAALAGAVLFRVGKIGTSHDAMGPYVTSLVWDYPRANPKNGDAQYDAAISAWKCTATFTGLPLFNADFGKKLFEVFVQPAGGNNCAYEVANYEVFWPKLIDPAGSHVDDSNFAKNHPGLNLSAAASDAGDDRAASTRAPNWFYYWRQVTTAAGNSLYDCGADSWGETPAMYSFGRDGAKGPYCGPHNRILIGPKSCNQRFYSGLQTTGISDFYDVIRHENKHVAQTVDFSNVAFGTSISDADPVDDSHWSFNIEKPDEPPWPPLPTGRIYNHYFDFDGDFDYDELAEDLDVNVNDAPDYFDFPVEYDIELEAKTAEAPRDETNLADQDWGSPGKNHFGTLFND